MIRSEKGITRSMSALQTASQPEDFDKENQEEEEAQDTNHDLKITNELNGGDAEATTPAPAPAPVAAATPANPMSTDCPATDMCQLDGEEEVDSEGCWACYQFYRKDLCEKHRLADTPVWDAQCALDGEIRDDYCKTWSEMEPPEKKEECFYVNSGYADQFCEKSKKTGFIGRCGQDEQLGEGYCKHWGAELKGFDVCFPKQSYLKVYCDKKMEDKEFDDVCATNVAIGPNFCEAFSEEEALKSSCVDQNDYWKAFCDKKATDSTGVPECATDARTNVDYCNQLALKKEEIHECWPVQGFPAAFCRETKMEDPRCKDVGGASTDAERHGETTGALSEGGETRTVAEEEAEVKAFKADEAAGGSQDDAALNAGAALQMNLLREQQQKDLATQKRLAGDLISSDPQVEDLSLPHGWRSGWDTHFNRFFYFPVEESSSSWKKIPNIPPTFEKPEHAWVNPLMKGAIWNEDTLERKAEEQEPMPPESVFLKTGSENEQPWSHEHAEAVLKSLEMRGAQARSTNIASQEFSTLKLGEDSLVAEQQEPLSHHKSHLSSTQVRHSSSPMEKLRSWKKDHHEHADKEVQSMLRISHPVHLNSVKSNGGGYHKLKPRKVHEPERSVLQQ